MNQPDLDIPITLYAEQKPLAVSVKTTAQILDTSERYVRKLIAEGKLEVIHIGQRGTPPRCTKPAAGITRVLYRSIEKLLTPDAERAA